MIEHHTMLDNNSLAVLCTPSVIYSAAYIKLSD